MLDRTALGESSPVFPLEFPIPAATANGSPFRKRLTPRAIMRRIFPGLIVPRTLKTSLRSLAAGLSWLAGRTQAPTQFSHHPS